MASTSTAASVSAVPLAGLIPTKLHAPRARPDLVLRPRLVERLEQGLWKKLTLISAAAGSGKTTLVIQWMKETSAAVAWLSLDEADNEVQRFLGYLIGALRELKPRLGRDVEALLQAPGPLDWRHLLTAVVVIPLAREPGERLVLVLDDYHVLDNPELEEIIGWLLDHLPACLHLLITTRRDPPLALARLRVRGELSEFRDEDLRFSTTEAGEFYNRIMALELAAEDVALLEARTEGWAAAIQLSALSLRDQSDKHGFIEALQGDQRPFADYLVQEVLERQPAAVKEFLLKTSVLRRLCGSLCSALLEREDGQAMLEALERANLFMVPLDSRGEWYRYHHLFAELLRRRREQALPGVAAALHRRASRWYAEQGLAHEAVDHARRSGDLPWMATLVERWGNSLLKRSELETLHRWLLALPRELFEHHPWLAIFDAWCALPGAGVEPVEAALARADHVLETTQNLSAEERRQLQANAMAIRSFIASRLGDPQRGIELAQQALQQLPPEALQLNAILSVSVGTNLRLLGDYDRALPFLDQAQSVGCSSGHFSSAIGAMCTKAWIHRIRGQLREAERICRATKALVEQEGFGRLAMAGYVHLETAWVHFERHQLDEAAAEIEHCLEECIVGVDLSFLVPAYTLRLVIALMQTDQAKMDETLARVAALPPHSHWNPDDMAELEAARALVALTAGDLNRARSLLGEYDLNELEPHTRQHFLNLVRVRLAMGQGQDVSAAIERQISVAEGEGRLGDSLNWRGLRTLQLVTTGHTAEAVLELEHAVILAKPEGALQVFATDWDTFKPLRPKLRNPEARGYLAVLDGMPKPAVVSPTTTAPTQTAQLTLEEPLSGRELEVLQLAARGLSNQAIANKLFVSVGTVKTHMHNILSKFAVRNRTEAVHHGRALGLIVDE